VSDPARSLVAVGLAGTAGVLLWAAHPPRGHGLVAFLVPAVLVVALRVAGGGDVRDRRATAPSAGVASALGVIAGGVGYGAMIAWLIAPAGPVGWALLVLIQGAWLGLWAALVTRWLQSDLLPVIAALAWVGMDTLRGRVPLSGFRWGELAYSQVDSAWFVPLGRVLGGSGITFAVVLIGVAALESLLALRTGDRTDPPRAPLIQVVGATLLTTLITVGPPATAGSIDVLAVQGNDIRHWIQQPPLAPLVITTNLHDLTLAAVAEGGRPDLTVWPESSIDRDPRRSEWSVLGELADGAATAAGVLVAGVSLDGPDVRTQRIIGALQLTEQGEVDRYVKRRIVPFGEYVPARRVIGGLPVLAQIPRDAVAGERAQAFEVAPGVFAAVVICFETLFPAIVRSNVLAGPTPAGIVLAITNDASFQESAEPDQHLAQSRMRAIETGRWVVHAALSGASAFVDPDGVVHDRTDLFEQATIRRDIPLAAGRTPFLVLGDVTGALGSLVLVGLVVTALAGRLVRRRPADARKPHAGR